SAVPHLVRAFASWPWQGVVLASSACALIAAALVAVGYRDGPVAFPQPPVSLLHIARVARVRESRLAPSGYLGHMWELYAMWSLVTLFFADVFARGAAAPSAGGRAALAGFAVIATGALGCVVAGRWADRLGRERITIWSMVTSGACALIVGWLAAAPAPLLVAVALLGGFAVVADAAQCSARVTEVAPQDAVGTALTRQTSLGFLLTAGTIWMAALVSARFGWGIAFSLLALGPALGSASMARLKTIRSRQSGARGVRPPGMRAAPATSLPFPDAELDAGAERPAAQREG